MTALTGAAFAAAEVLTHIDGGHPATLGATVEIAEPGQTTRRRWTPAPRVRMSTESAGLVRQNPPRRQPSVSIDRVTDIPRNAVGRTARLAALPLGFAGRAALGLGKRVTGMASEVISAEIQQRTAEHLFKVLGQLKGGAMKMGQALSVFEAALPEEIAGPYRAALTKLQEAAPPLPAGQRAQGAGGRARAALAAAVPGARRHPGGRGEHRPGAPGGLAGRPRGRGQGPVPGCRRGPARRPRTSCPGWPPCSGSSSPGLDVKPLVAELRARVTEELDYELEAAAQKAFAKAYADDDEILVPRVVAAAPRVLVTEWIDGTPLSHVISSGSPSERDLAGLRLATPALLRARAGPACCTPTHTRATSGCSTTAASACSTSARWPGCPAGTRNRSAG